MFEDFKNKILEHNTLGKAKFPQLPPEVAAKFKELCLDPETVTIKQLFPEVLDADGCDLSLMSGVEMETMITYATTRKYLVEKYPLKRAEVFGQQWNEETEVPNQIDPAKARDDPKSRVFFQALLAMKTIYDKLRVLQTQATEYEKICLRLYGHSSYNWNHARNVKSFRETFTDIDLFELVEVYFKICRKYHVPTFEEPYYFLDTLRRQEIKLEVGVGRRERKIKF